MPANPQDLANLFLLEAGRCYISSAGEMDGDDLMSRCFGELYGDGDFKTAWDRIANDDAAFQLYSDAWDIVMKARPGIDYFTQFREGVRS